MRKIAIALLVFLSFTFAAHAQTSAVTATITDSDNQTWNNGSYTISFIQSSGNSAPPVWNGAPLDAAHKLFKGVMSPSGVLTVSIPDSTFITPSGSSWLFVLCPYSSGSCSQIQTPVVGPSVDLSATLSGGITAPRFPAVPGAYGYLDVEVTPIPPPGGFYFNVTNNLQRVWNGASWQNGGGGGGGGGGSVGPGSVNSVACFNTTTSVQNCNDNITDIGGVVTIPTTTQIGGGSGPASIALPSGAPSGCPTPVASTNIICSDGTLNTLDASVNGGPYVPFAPNAPVYNVKNYGAIGDFAHIAQDTAGIQAAFTAALATGGTVFFPHGQYQFDNSAGLYLINNAVGLTVLGEDKSSIVYFNTLANYGWSFTNANGLTIKNMYLQYQPTRTTRGGGGPLSIDSSTNVLVENNYFNNTNLSGLRLGNNNNVRVIGNTIANSLANGIFSVNNINMKFVNTNCVNNGDGCEEYSFFDAGTTQPFCDNISSTGMSSNNDNAGFIVNGCTNVSISNFVITGAGGFAINITQDPATTTTHFPDMVEIGNGSIFGTGYGTNASNTVNAPGLQINISGTPATNQRIILHDIHIVHTAQRALFLGDHNTVNLSANNIWIDDAGGATGTSGNEAIVVAGGNQVKLSTFSVANANRYALRDTLATYLEVNDFTSINNQVGNTSVATIRNDSTGTFLLDGVKMVDTYATTNRSAIQNGVTSGTFQVNNVQTMCTVNPCGVVVGLANPAVPLQYSGFGSAITYSSAACETSFGPTTVSGGATTTTGLNCLPANAIIDAVVYRITTTITTAANFTIGDAGSATRYCGTKTGLTAGTTGTCTAQGYYLNPTAAGVLITPNATPGAGAMRLLVYYHTWTAPTS